METQRVESIEDYLSPASAHWARVRTTQVDMIPTPLQMQPTDYIRNSWEKRPYGQTQKIIVASVHDGEMWALRATWHDSGPGERTFPDAFAIALPVRNNPVLALMGAKDAPIHYLRWSDSKEGLLSLMAMGIGQSQPGANVKHTAKAVSEDSVWKLVIVRALGTGKDIAPLVVGKKTGVGFALWRGANNERAGIKAFSIDWTDLELEP